MRVQLKCGRNELSVEGTPEQIERQVEIWQRQNKPSEEYLKVCEMIRECARKRNIPHADNSPIIALAQILLADHQAGV